MAQQDTMLPNQLNSEKTNIKPAFEMGSQSH